MEKFLLIAALSCLSPQHTTLEALRDFADKPPTSGGNSFKMCNIASAQTYTFSQPIRNPLLAVYSLGNPNRKRNYKNKYQSYRLFREEQNPADHF